MQPPIDSRKLFYFATVVEHGSLRKAATQLSISQPGLSMAMDRLEAEIGAKLLERGPAGVVPTEFGELLCTHARLIKEEMSLIEARVANSQKNGPRVITVGTLPSLAANIVPNAVSLWQKNNKEVRLRVIDDVQVKLLLGLQNGAFDFILGQTGFYNVLDGMKQRVLFRDRLCIFARYEHPLFKKRKLTWSDLMRFSWVLPMVGGRQRSLLEKLVAAHGLGMPKQLIECGTIGFTRSLVALSDNLAMLPEHAIADGLKDRTVRPLPITDPALDRDIVVTFRERSPPDNVARELITHIKSAGLKLSTKK